MLVEESLFLVMPEVGSTHTINDSGNSKPELRNTSFNGGKQ